MNAVPFDHDVIKFYSAEILGAIEHMHKLGIAHRDIKVFVFKIYCINIIYKAKILFLIKIF